ncbi:hypothetical protein HY415_01190 [Candidatus Kaiserbacteria bacterium]|nr:hypothetical protein [Candidatus Kaiserbacteria bacterium]
MEKEEEGATHGLVHMRDQKEALSILGMDDFNQGVTLCVCCVKQRAQTCPFEERRVGVCPEYVLDEGNPSETEQRVLAFLTRPPN